MPLPGLTSLAVPVAVENQEHSSGFLGFLVVFLLAVAIYLLVRNLVARLRRMNYRHAQEEAAASPTPDPAKRVPRIDRPDAL